MMVWRAAVAFALTVLFGLPLVQVLLHLYDAGAWEWSGEDVGRIAWLAANTTLLVAGTCLIAVPAGTLLAVLLFRTGLVGRRLLMAVMVLLLFVPLPVIVSSWQAFLGSGGLLPIELWATGVDRPWATGWGPAVWVHAVAAIPWVTCIVGLGLRWVEPELEDEAALLLSPWRVICFVTLPRCRASILAATLFVALQTANEISVTDMMLISTLAEEVYTRFTLGESLGGTVVRSLPGLLAVIALLSAAAPRLERALPPLPILLRAPRILIHRPGLLGLACLGAMFAVLLVPAAGLVWRLGEAGEPRTWSAVHAWNQLHGTAVSYFRPLIMSVGTALASGIAVAGLALVCCWLARDSRPMRVFLLVLMTAAWVMPAPLVGIGLKEFILASVKPPPTDAAAEGVDSRERGESQGVRLGEIWSAAVYFGPSPLPILWAHLIRLLPAAVLFLWPVMRVIPKGLLEAARIEGPGPVRELLFVIWPLTRRAAAVIALAVSALALGELAAAGRVETPGWECFSRLLFDRMHYGADSTVAALSLMLLFGVIAYTLLTLGVWWAVRHQSRNSTL
jgi:iron(III) transport system permease protein